MYADGVMRVHQVTKTWRNFQNGRKDIRDEDRNGLPDALSTNLCLGSLNNTWGGR
jgi:hypothetical protein